MVAPKRHDASVRPPTPPATSSTRTFEILDRDGAVVVFSGDLMSRGFGIVSAKATEDTRLVVVGQGRIRLLLRHAGAGQPSLFPSVDAICTHLAMSRKHLLPPPPRPG